ncbi:glycogen/starch/alpha-glucan phosphorylase [Planctomycetota bacterium]
MAEPQPRTTIDDAAPGVLVEDDRTGMHPETLERAVMDHLYYTCSKDERTATKLDIFLAVAHAVRDRLVHRWIKTQQTYYDRDAKRVYYLSAEFLRGRALAMNLINLGQYEAARQILAQHGIDLTQLLEEEMDPGLGNGGLGRLAACFVDSMATLGLPGYGYGIRYEFGIFEQRIRDGWQVEHPDMWARYGNVWELARHEYAVRVKLYGRVVTHDAGNGGTGYRWVDTQEVLAVPYDMPIAGYRNNTVNNLRLWSAQATEEFKLAVFNDGDYRRAVEEKVLSETISKVLYPRDDTPEGRELRLKQQYFFVCATLHDIIRRYKNAHDDFGAFSSKVAIQLNDTHPAIAVAELMRILLDEEGMPWDRAWEIVRDTIAFTNHTLLPEALERWPVWLFEKLLPRHLMIIYEINHRFLRQVRIFSPDDHDRPRRMSIIEEGKEKQVRMAHLAVVGSHSVNGVAELHSELVRTQLLSDFAEMWPERFNNKTNGVTPRRWMLLCNSELAALISDRIGRDWIVNLDELRRLLPLENDEGFRKQVREVKVQNKQRLAGVIEQRCGVSVNVGSLFDVQVKRLHEYKRQLLNCLHIIHLYRLLRLDPRADVVPRTFIFGGKAAPGYETAKLHMKLINDLASVIDKDQAIRDRIKVLFMANYGVSLAERIIPAADVSEQISLAGKEASGTGNMKFAMNGALTVGTLDGANIEIREEVGAENFFLFGMKADEVASLRRSGYNPRDFIERSEDLRAVLDMIASGMFSPGEPDRFNGVVDQLYNHDPYMVCADFDSYVACQAHVSRVYRDPEEWTRRAIRNIGNMGKFSSDRTIREYAEEIWRAEPVSIEI